MNAEQTGTCLCASMAYRPYIHSAGTVLLKDVGPRGWVRMVSYQLNQLHAGTATVELEKRPPILLRPGDAWLVPPDRAIRVTAAARVETTWIHFSVDQNPAWCAVDPRTSFAGAYAHMPAMRQPAPETVWGIRLEGAVPPAALENLGVDLREVATRWCRATRLATMSANIELERLLMHWLAAAAERSTTRPAATTAERIQRAEVAAWQHIGANFGAKEMAALAHLSRAHFSRAYRKLRGHPVRDTLNRMRVAEAQRLLRETNLTVTEIAARLNYSTPMAFQRMFKSITGHTPTRWRAMPPISGTPRDRQTETPWDLHADTAPRDASPHRP